MGGPPLCQRPSSLAGAACVVQERVCERGMFIFIERGRERKFEGVDGAIHADSTGY